MLADEGKEKGVRAGGGERDGEFIRHSFAKQNHGGKREMVERRRVCGFVREIQK